MHVEKVTPDKLRPEDIIFEPDTGKFWTIDEIHGDVSNDENTFTGPFDSWNIWYRELHFSVDTSDPNITQCELWPDNIIIGSDINLIASPEHSFWRVIEE